MHAYSCYLHFVLAAAFIASAVLEAAVSSPARCRYLPGDPDWPCEEDWKQLNQSVGGRLIIGKPLAQLVCYTNYQATACANLQAEWDTESIFFKDPVNVMSPYWLNNSCSPFLNSTCNLGNLASYAINVSCAEDIAAGFKFAQAKNIRPTVKNTGHDYLGRSTGEGALALWTHNLKDIFFFNYSSKSYTGPAAKLGAGVQAFEIYAAAEEHGLRVTGGLCPTVGMVGGYVQGGGHGPLEGKYGLAADNTLEFEVVTADGRYLVATPTQNSDLYWALNGGGGGTYAVVLSQTTKAHADGPVAGAILTFEKPGNENTYWSAVETWQKQLLVLNNILGFNSYWSLTNASFEILATLPDANASAMSAALEPFVQELKKLNIEPNYQVTVKPTYYQHFKEYTPNYTTGVIIGGRLIPRSTIENNLPNLVDAFRKITSTGYQVAITGSSSNLTHARVGNTIGSNAVLPAWRDSLAWVNMGVNFDVTGSTKLMQDIEAQMNMDQDQLKALTPGGGAYMNEGTFDNPDWKQDYYGTNYDKLLRIKKKHDPNFILYGAASVGSDYWTVAGDGRLCKT